MNLEQNTNVQTENEPISISAFLENIPPNQLKTINDLAIYRYSRISNSWSDFFSEPEVQLHCPQETCNGIRFFRCYNRQEIRLNTENFSFFYITYRCSNCQATQKTYSLAAKILEEKKTIGQCYKLGELPPYGPPVPARVIKLIGPDREIFLKGRTCENQGLGVGAFIYYRRVVEQQKNRIISEIIKVAEKLNARQENIELLKKAIEETQFSRVMNSIKDAIPETLLINGLNPVTLLYSALSEGVHNLSDQECLEIATSVRIVLAELSERLSQSLKDEAELTNALNRLTRKK